MDTAAIKAEIRTQQYLALQDVELQLASGAERITMMDGTTISREAAWAASQSIRACWDRDLAYDGQRRMNDGTWYARGQQADGGYVLVPLGRSPG